jgi:hypothetical protein
MNKSHALSPRKVTRTDSPDPWFLRFISKALKKINEPNSKQMTMVFTKLEKKFK